MTDLRTLGRAMREMDRKPLPDPGTKEWDDYRKLIAAFDAALAAEPAPAPDVADLVNEAQEFIDTSEPSHEAETLVARLMVRLETLARERDEALISERNLGNLLARIHRDGGHYQAKHGTLKACVDADLIVSGLLGKADSLAAAEARVKELEGALALYRDAVRFDVQMSGPRFLGSNVSALKRAWEHDRAAIIKDTAD